jgi:septum formation topological specificity factor MinE
MTDQSESTPPTWDGDVNEAATEEWVEETTPFERVRDVLDVTTEPQYAKEIADRARVSEPTARKHLSTFVEVGRAEEISTGRGTRYKRSAQSVAMSRIAAIHREYSKRELTDSIERLREEIASLREEYGANDPDDLAFELESGDEGWQAVARWRSLKENLDIAKAALSLYDFDPDEGGTAAAEADESRAKDASRGAFGNDSQAYV